MTALPISYTLRRLVLMVPVLIGVTVLAFSLIHITPGDPIRLILGDAYDQTEADRLRHELGLDQPLPRQYLNYLTNLAQGNLGTSIFTGRPVISMLFERVPVTLTLATCSIAIALLIAVPLGVASAARPGTAADMLASFVGTIGVAVPVMWTGILLLLVFGLQLRWLPVGGGPAQFGLAAFVLPSLALGVQSAALTTRLVRATFSQVLTEEYIRTARAKGLGRGLIYGRHAGRNAVGVIVTAIGLEFGGLLGGAVLTERIFSLPGLGTLLLDSVERRDFPVIQGAIFFVAFGLLLVNLFVDLLYAFLDPRTRN